MRPLERLRTLRISSCPARHASRRAGSPRINLSSLHRFIASSLHRRASSAALHHTALVEPCCHAPPCTTTHTAARYRALADPPREPWRRLPLLFGSSASAVCLPTVSLPWPAMRATGRQWALSATRSVSPWTCNVGWLPVCTRARFCKANTSTACPAVNPVYRPCTTGTLANCPSPTGLRAPWIKFSLGFSVPKFQSLPS